jgi:diadenosine tetraphosphatase ApaH/serine/threonine PP2A family protein phosphatase
MVDRLVEEAERSDYAFDPAGLVAPSGRLDAPILFGLHWPPLTEDLPEYPTMRDMIYNPCMQWMAQKFGGLDEALTFDFRPLALRKKPGYSAHPPWHDMPSGMLEIIDETLQEIMEAATAKVAVYFGKHDYKIYRKLYPASEALKLSDVPMYSRNFTHACVEYLESGPNTGEIRRLVFFCYHPGLSLYLKRIIDHSHVNTAPEVALRGVHQVQARLMEAMCDLAAVIVGRSGVCQGMFRLSDKPVLKPLHKQRPTPGVPAALDLRVNTKHRHTFHLACRAYGKEAKSGLLYTTESLPKRLVSLI